MKKLFILGCPRSGTTMLQQALNRHPQIVIPPETKFFFSFLGRSLATQRRHIQRLTEDLGVFIQPPRCQVYSTADAQALYECVASAYIQRLGRQDVAYFGEKTPEHTGRVRLIRCLYPAAKFILIYRDGRDVALSLTKVPWMSSSIDVNFLVWLYYYQVYARLRSDPSLDLLCVKYENLVTEPVRELQRIAAFLSIPYDDAMAKGYGNCEGIPRREYVWKARALERISSDRVGLWRQELSMIEIGRLEYMGASALDALGYALLSDGKRIPSFGYWVKLIWSLGMLMLRLPWAPLCQELRVRLIEAGGLGFSRSSSDVA